MNKQQIKPFVWGAVVGGIALAIVLFATGMAVTGGSAERSAKLMARSAVAASLAEICVAQFEAAPDKAVKLAAMKDLQSWRRGPYVSEQGWATMPGRERGASEVASECAVLLAKIPS